MSQGLVDQLDILVEDKAILLFDNLGLLLKFIHQSQAGGDHVAAAEACSRLILLLHSLVRIRHESFI